MNAGDVASVIEVLKDAAFFDQLVESAVARATVGFYGLGGLSLGGLIAAVWSGVKLREDSDYWPGVFFGLFTFVFLGAIAVISFINLLYPEAAAINSLFSS